MGQYILCALLAVVSTVLCAQDSPSTITGCSQHRENCASIRVSKELMGGLLQKMRTTTVKVNSHELLPTIKGCSRKDGKCGSIRVSKEFMAGLLQKLRMTTVSSDELLASIKGCSQNGTKCGSISKERMGGLLQTLLAAYGGGERQ